MSLIFILIISFAFFTQSLLGFGGGLICIPLLSLFMPVQDVVSMVMIYQFSMGLLIFKIHHHVRWSYILKMLPATIIGAVCGVFLLNYIPGDVMRGILAGYIILHLLRKHTSFDPLGWFIRKGGAHISGLMGGTLNAMIGGGAPAFILYLRDALSDSKEFRAAIMMILLLSNIPRVIGTVGTGLLTYDLFIMALYAYPAFLASMVLGQILHDKVPQKRFFIAVECLLVLSACLLIAKILL